MKNFVKLDETKLSEEFVLSRDIDIIYTRFTSKPGFLPHLEVKTHRVSLYASIPYKICTKQREILTPSSAEDIEKDKQRKLRKQATKHLKQKHLWRRDD